MEIFEKNISSLKEKLTAYSINDAGTKATLKKVFAEHQYLLDPHGAVGYNALEQYLSGHPLEKGIVVETAHQVKFYDVVEPVINVKIPIPEIVQEQVKMKKETILIENNSSALKNYLNSFS